MHRKFVRSALVLSLLVPAGAAFAKDVRIEKRFPLQSGGSFTLAGIGSAVVRGGTGSEAVVVITSDREDFRELFDVKYDSQPSRLGVTIERRNKGVFSWFGGFRGWVKVDVTLPRQVQADVRSSGGGIQISNLQGAVKASSSGGGVNVAEIDGNVVLASSGGGVRAEAIRGSVQAGSSGGGVEVKAIGGAAKLESSGGGIVAQGVAGDVDASSSGGGVTVEEARGRVEAGSSGGAVRVSFAAGNSKGGDVQSSGGGVTVRVDPGVGLQIDASSSGGRVASDLSVKGSSTKNSLRGTLNQGGAVLKVRSSGGGVTLTPR
jgi:hypothetical protein